MPNLKDIKRRIVSVKNTQKITHAMKLVSAAKFARANHAVLAARPYGDGFETMVNKVVLAAGDVHTPLTEVRSKNKRELLVLVSTDRGLCGSLNSALFKVTARFVKEKVDLGITLDTVAWGRRAAMFCKKVKWTLLSEKERVTEKPKYEVAVGLAEELIQVYVDEKYDAIHVAFVEFKSALSQVPMIKQLLPVVPQKLKDESPTSGAGIILEPKAQELIGPVLERLVVAQTFRILLEAAASEHGARMTAMDSATKNAKEVIRKLTLQYNRGRQAAITKELIEITSGAEAL
jgi:F-type H+-transporting ATPase subunit gamma